MAVGRRKIPAKTNVSISVWIFAASTGECLYGRCLAGRASLCRVTRKGLTLAYPRSVLWCENRCSFFHSKSPKASIQPTVHNDLSEFIACKWEGTCCHNLLKADCWSSSRLAKTVSGGARVWSFGGVPADTA